MPINAGTIFVNVLPNTTGFGPALNTQMGRIASSASRTGTALSRRLTLPIVAAGAAAVKLNVDFESAMSKITGLVGISRKQTEEWGDEILGLAGKLPQAPQELAEALYFVSSAGIATKDAMEVVRISAKAAAAGLGDTAGIADLLTSALNAYGIENLSAAEASDILVAAVREGKGEASDFATSLGRVIPVAQAMGIEFDQVSAAVSALTLGGLNVPEAVTAIRGFMTTLIKPTKEARDVFKEAGTSIDEIRQITESQGLRVGLTRLKELIGGNLDTMGKLIPNVRALTGFLSLTGANAEQVNEIFNELATATGSTEHAFDEAATTAEFKLNAALSSVKAAGIELGRALTPMVEALGRGIQKLADWFGDLSDEQQANILKWAALLAVIGPVLRIFGGLLGTGIRVVNMLAALGGAGRTAATGLAATNTSAATMATTVGKTKTAGLTGSLGRLGAVLRGAGIAAGIAFIGSTIQGAISDAMAYNQAIDDIIAGTTTAFQVQKDIHDRIEEMSWWELATQGVRELLPGIDSIRELGENLPEESAAAAAEAAAAIKEEWLKILGRDDFVSALDKGVGSISDFIESVGNTPTALQPATTALVEQLAHFEQLGGNLDDVNLEYLRLLTQSGNVAEASNIVSGMVDRQRRAWEKNHIILKGNEHENRLLAAQVASVTNATDQQRVMVLRGNAALDEAGIKLSKMEQATFNALVETGNLGGAQALLSDKLRASGIEGAGLYQQLKNLDKTFTAKVNADTAGALADVQTVQAAITTLTGKTYYINLGVTNPQLVNLVNGPEPRHSGGPVRAGTPYLVGSAGHEELFVPDRGGHIVPGSVVGAAAAAGAGGSQVLDIVDSNLGLVMTGVLREADEHEARGGRMRR